MVATEPGVEQLIGRLSYDELASGIAEGKIGGKPALKRLLQLGQARFATLAADPASPFKKTYEQLAADYANTLESNDIQGFCLREAGYLLGTARDIQSIGGNQDDIRAVETRAENWQNALSRQTQVTVSSNIRQNLPSSLNAK
ncbi:MAG: hypothetical protein WC625_07580 [Caldisericia bacterium]